MPMRRDLAWSIAVILCVVFVLPTRAQEKNAAGSPAATEASTSPDAIEAIKQSSVASKETAVATSMPASIAQSPPITLTVKADLGAQQATVIEGDTVLYVWPISSGTSGFTTPTGTFQPTSANKMWYSRQYDWTPMPYAVFFTKGVAFHGTNATGRLGKSASHGCIRLATNHAEQLFELVHKHGFAQTRIIVFGTAKQDAPAVANRAPSAMDRPALSSAQPPSWMTPNFWDRP